MMFIAGVIKIAFQKCLEYLNELRNLIDSITTNELHVDHRINVIEI